MPAAFSFEALIQPTALEDFLANHYESAPLRIERGDPGFYADLLTLDQVDAWLATGAVRYPDVLMVQHEVDLGKAEYTLADDRIDVERLYRRFADGATIVIHNLERHLPGLAALCRASERLFSMPFQTNIYLSPPQAQGFRTHYDTHDVFVLQAAGSKQWSLYDTKLALPLPGQAFDKTRDFAGQKSASFTLHAGDLLYCPRGLMHDAHSTDEASLHITFGLLGKTRADLLIEAVAAACVADPEFRRTLPPGFANPGFDRADLRACLASLVRRVAEAEHFIDPAFDQMVDNFIASRRPAYDGHLTERLVASDLDLDATLAPRPDLIWRLEIDEAAATLTLLIAGSTLTLPAFTAPAIRFMLGAPCFLVRELPGDIDDAARLVLARRFLREGLLTREVRAAA